MVDIAFENDEEEEVRIGVARTLIVVGRMRKKDSGINAAAAAAADVVSFIFTSFGYKKKVGKNCEWWLVCVCVCVCVCVWVGG